MILVQGERVFAYFDILPTQCAQSDAGCVERRKLPRCKLRDVPRSIHLHEAGAGDATMDVFAWLGLQNRIVHFPPVARVSSDFLLLFSPLLLVAALHCRSLVYSHLPSSAGNSSTSRGKQRRRCCTSFTHYLVLTSLLIEGNIGRVRRFANTEGTRIIIRSRGGDIFSSRDSSTKLRRRNANISFVV